MSFVELNIQKLLVKLDRYDSKSRCYNCAFFRHEAHADTHSGYSCSRFQTRTSDWLKQAECGDGSQYGLAFDVIAYQSAFLEHSLPLHELTLSQASYDRWHVMPPCSFPQLLLKTSLNTRTQAFPNVCSFTLTPSGSAVSLGSKTLTTAKGHLLI